MKPCEARTRRAPLYELLPHQGSDVVHGVRLRRDRVLPGEAEGLEPPRHFRHDVAHFLTQAVQAGVAAANDDVAIVGMAFGGFAAAGDHEVRQRICVVLHGVGKRVEHRLRRWFMRRTDIGTGHRVRVAIDQPPAFERLT